MRQHYHGGCLSFDLLDGFVLLHVRDTVDNRIDLASESTTMLEGTLGCSQFNFPPRIEILGTRKNHISVMLDEHARKMTKRDKSAVDEDRIKRHSGRHESSHLPETDAVVPDVQSALTLGLAEDTICCAREVVGDLEDIRDSLWNGDGEDEKV